MSLAARRTGGEWVVAALEAEGVRHVFGIPGVHNLAIYDALLRQDRIAHVLARHEQGAGLHGGRLRARLGAPRRRRRDDGAGRDQRADAARRGPRGLSARAPRDVGRPQRAGRAGPGRAPRGAEPDRVLPAGQPVGRRPPERRRDSRRGPGRVPPLPDRPAGPGHAVDPDRSAQRARRGAAHAGRRGPASAVRHRTGGGGGPLSRPRPAAAPRRGRRGDRGRGDGGAPGPRAPARRRR